VRDRGLCAEVDVGVGDFRLDLSFTVEPGETIAVVGPNGAGKTTLLRALAGLLPIDTGRIALADHVLDDTASGAFVPVEERSIGVVFQDYLLFPHLSALDNVAFGLRSRGTSSPRARERARGWLTRVGLGNHLEAKPRQLSGGQAQRVALARALAIEPTMLLLDEPLAALDATTRVETRRDLRRHLAAHDGVRIVITHDPLDAAALADRILVLEGGRLVQQGTLAGITARPRSRYVADLVGVNLFAGRARGNHVDVEGLELTVADLVEGDVLLSVAPRAVTLSRVRPQGTARNVWPGIIDGVEPIGDRTRVRVRGAVTVVAEVTDLAARDLQLTDGVEVWVAVKATEIDVSLPLPRHLRAIQSFWRSRKFEDLQTGGGVMSSPKRRWNVARYSASSPRPSESQSSSDTLALAVVISGPPHEHAYRSFGSSVVIAWWINAATSNGSVALARPAA
jgi:molybdate transport system ATP-binding protein